MNLLEGLNPQQKEAVTTCDKHVRIIAGAGSGKTKVITTRIAYLIEEIGILPYRILAITFTNKAAKEMKERVNHLLGDYNQNVNISTIHSFCVRLLREDIHLLDYPNDFVILDSDDQRSILRDLYKKYKVENKTISYAQMLGYISSNKTNLISPEKAKEMAFNDQDELKADIYHDYQKHLNEIKALDFDDLLIFAYRILKTSDEVRQKWQSRFDYIHVDEFQDVDELQYNIIKLLTGEHTLLCVVGDPDQTIYTWRGANVSIIMNFDKDFNDVASIYLNQNYRSTKAILAAANNVIKNNKKRLDKELFTENENNELITYYSSNDEKYEATWISEQIRLYHQDGIKYGDIAILYRSNYLSRNLEKSLLDFNIPYRIYGGVKFFERAEIKDALSYLRLLVQNNDSYTQLAIKRIINVPKRGIGQKTLDTIANLAQELNVNYYEVLKTQKISGAKVQNSINRFVTLIEESRKRLNDHQPVADILNYMLEASGYYDMLKLAREQERIENIEELLEDIRTYFKNNPDGSLEDYLQSISLYTDSDDSQTNNDDVVQLMSVHSAKGLEFSHVFIYSLCEGIFPNERSVNEGGSDALEEERRLAYVAFTRAKEKLHISSSAGFSYITNSNKLPSRFIEEIGDELLVKEGHADYNNDYEAKAKKPIKSGYLSNINKGSLTTKKKAKYRKGDLVHHQVFGDGVIISVKDDVATIAFDKRYGMRKIGVKHPSLKRK